MAITPSEGTVLRLVNQDGNTVTTEQTGLLLLNGSTVCAHGFGPKSASNVMAIMGYTGLCLCVCVCVCV